MGEPRVICLHPVPRWLRRSVLASPLSHSAETRHPVHGSLCLDTPMHPRAQGQSKSLGCHLAQPDPSGSLAGTPHVAAREPLASRPRLPASL